ncbi:hypothetical protein QNO06_16845 [Arthrobacter sp. zg-Y20]|uniref:hypothetical protein n=1 Tax=Arthrobacter sp. zg-Y20 TaxID=2886938 RepID=UPI0024DF6BC8|nr:hypothetical protein [Arthrobacter sp. zg-Y20]WIB06157.1 hypothetical protein QNO06_16845 [Arthrobacter sp. zg-Y20]
MTAFSQSPAPSAGGSVHSAPAFRHASAGLVPAALRAAVLAVALGLAACTPAPPPQQDSQSAPASSPTAGPSSTPTFSAGAGSAADCPPLPATVPSNNPDRGNFSAADADTSALTRSDGGSTAVADADITKSGSSSNPEASAAAGLNAAVLVSGGSRLSLLNATVSSTGAGAGGVFSSGTGSLVELGSTTVRTDGASAPAVGAGDGGSVTGTDLTLSTDEGNASPIAAGGEGQISINRSTAVGEAAPAIYSAGDISVCAVAGTSRSAEAAVVEGTNTLISTRSELSGGTHGVHLLQGSDGGPAGGSLTLTGGSLNAGDGDAVLIEGVPATVSISQGSTVSADSGNLVSVTGGGSGTVEMTETELTGNLSAQQGSSLAVSLTANSSVTGTLANVGVTLDDTSRISLQADSAASSVAGALVSGGQVTNITGNGHTLTYDPSEPENAYLNGGTYALARGGTLTPG